MGGVAGALASHADRFVAGLGAHKTPLIRALLLRLVTAERTRAIVPISELLELSREVGEIQRLINQMVDARLLVVQTIEGGKGSTVEIVHESLLQGWPALRRWLDENQDDAALVDQLRIAARQWQQKGFDVGLLWRGESANEAKKFRTRYKGPLSDVERGFLDAVISHEIAQVRRRRIAVIGGFAALGAIVIAAMVALVIIQKSRAEAKDNLARAEISQKEAETAQQEAQHQLVIAQKNLKDRIAAETKTAQVTEEKHEVDQELNKSKEDLIKERDNATDSAKQAQAAQLRAEASARAAEKAEAEAKASREVALKAEDKARKLYEKEHDRAERLNQQLGSTAIDTLKK
jgi:hypothetical protein